MLFIFALLNGLLLLATFITLWRYEAWWVRGWDFPRLQIAVVAALVLLLQVVLLDFAETATVVLVGLTALCLGYQVWWIAAYTPFFPLEVQPAPADDPDNTICIMNANVLTTNKNAAGLLREVYRWQPDILVTLETNAWWQQQLDVLGTDYPYSIKCPLENLYGMHVYSRLPLEDTAIQFLVEQNIPSMHALAVLPSGQKVCVHFLHPAPPSPSENDESAERDAELLVVAKSVVDAELPVIVAGDLNDVAWSATTRLFRKISGLLDPRVGRGMFNSFHADYWFVRWPLDHLFHSDHFTLKDIRRLPSFGSDHFPMLITLVYSPAQRVKQDGPESSASEEAWADEKIDAQPARDVHQPQA